MDNIAAVRFFHDQNACRFCGKPIFTATEMAAKVGFARRTWFRWLDGKASEANNERVARWLIENTPFVPD